MSSQEYAEMIEIPVSTTQVVTIAAKEPEKQQKRPSPFAFLRGRSKTQPKEKTFDDYFEDKLPCGCIGTCTCNENQCDTPNTEKGCDCQPESACACENNIASPCTDNTDCDCGLENHSSDSDCRIEEPACSCAEADTPIKKRAKINIIGVQVAAIFVLAVGILLTNLFWQDSGINNILRSAFLKQEETVDERDYTQFTALCPTKGQMQVENGVITITEQGAVYSPANGTVLSVDKINDKYTITIGHSDKYKTVICGADYVYSAVGESVFTSTPVCYALDGGVEVTMYNSGAIISAFSITDGQVVWQS
ncbi:MAG: hypothetical protein IKL77_02570 [Clostridia bacterium]|nr:hypothetical protein [Clostridia bacterium]